MASLEYARVVGRFAVTRGDGADADEYPDTAYCDSGTVTFTPLVAKVTADPDDDVPLTIVNAPVVAYIGPDGWVSFNGQPEVWLVDLGSGAVTPSVPRDRPAYSVTFRNVEAQGGGHDLPTLLINPAAGSDTDLSLEMQNA